MPVKIVDYIGFDPDIINTHPDFLKNLKALLPYEAVIRPYVDGFGSGQGDYYEVVLGHASMFILYDDVTSVEYEAGTPWAHVAIVTLDYMDKISVATFGAPVRQTDD